MAHAGEIEGVVAFTGLSAAPGPEGLDTAVNRTMAARLEQVGRDHPGVLVIAYSGSYHAARAHMTPNQTFDPAGALPRKTILSVLIRSNSGMAWACVDTCGPQQAEPPARYTPGVHPAASVPEMPFDYDLDLGTPITASAPAVPAATAP
jgi:hypothetical protein